MKLIHADFDALRKKITFNTVTQKLYSEAMEQVDKILADDFPSSPIEDGSYVKKVNDHYTGEYLKVLQEYDVTSWLYERAFRKLAFAYMMTGERKYLDKYELAIDKCLQNPYWGPKGNEYDHCSSRMLRSLCVSLTWLGDALSGERFNKICDRMKIEVRGFEKKYSRMGDDYPIGPNDHQSKDLSGSGSAAWFLMAREPAEQKPYFGRFVYLFREKLIEETIGEDGGWPDGWTCTLYALMDMIAFFEVIEDATGENLTAHPRMQRTCDFFICAMSQHKCNTANGVIQPKYAYCHGPFWMAAAYRRKDLQFIAIDSLMQGRVDYDYCDYAFICYDETLEAQEFCGDGAMFARSVGWGRLGWGTNTGSVYLWLKSGPADAFCRNNQNGILLTAYGRQLFSDVSLPPKTGYQALWKCVYEDGLWTTKCASAILVNGQNQLKNRYGEDWGPIMKFHNPNRQKWGDEDAWWFDFEAPKAPLGRITGTKIADGAATLAGRADKCHGDLLQGYSRCCTMTRDGLIIIVDTLLPTDKASSFQFRANTAYKFYIKDKDRAAITAGDVSSDVLFLYDGDYSVSVDEWAFNPASGNYLTGDFKLKGNKAQLITLLRPYCDGKEHALDARLADRLLSVSFDSKLYEFDLDTISMINVQEYEI